MCCFILTFKFLVFQANSESSLVLYVECIEGVVGLTGCEQELHTSTQ